MPRPSRRTGEVKEEPVDDAPVAPRRGRVVDADLDDDEDEAPNAHAEDNDGFDYNELFEDLSKKIPDITEMARAAVKFGNPHRYILQKLMIEPSIPVKKFNILFINYVATVKLARHPCVVKYIKANANQLRDLAKTIVKTINEAKSSGDDDGDDRQVGHDMGMRLVILSEESTSKEWVSLAGEIQNSEIIGENSEMTKGERTLFLDMLDEMLKNNGSVTRKWVSDRALKINMSLVKCEKFLLSSIKDKWFQATNNATVIEMAPRTVAEMDPFIRAKYADSVHVCELCRRIIAKMIYTAECKKCKLYMHFNCFKNAAEFGNADGVECKKCDAKIELDEVNDEIKAKLRNPVVRQRSVTRTPTQSESEEDEEDDQRANKKPKVEDSE